ncbi:multidrug resistance domain protein [Burkholderia pseudomallei MSHR5613]|nr:multidrug resistance domain protein [Burkholderia pseudomallei MSHR5613]
MRCAGSGASPSSRCPPRAFVCTVARIDSPTRNGCAASSDGSSEITTGRRCTTLIQFPAAFCDGSIENALPVPAEKPSTRP